MSEPTGKYLAKVVERMTGVGEHIVYLAPRSTPSAARDVLINHASKNLRYALPERLTGTPDEIIEQLGRLTGPGTVDAGKFIYTIIIETSGA